MAKGTVDFTQTKQDMLDINKGLKDIVSYSNELGKIKNKYNKANEREQDILSDVLDATKSIMKNRKMLSDEQLNSVDLHKLERKLIAEGLHDQIKMVQKLKEENNIQKQINREVNAQAKLYENMGSSIDDFIRKIPGIGGLLADVLGTGDLGKEMSQGFRTEMARGGGVSEFLKNAGGEFAGGFGVSLFEGGSGGKDGKSKTQFRKSKDAVRRFFGEGSSSGIISAAGTVGVFAAVSGLFKMAMTDGVQSIGVLNTLKRTFFRGSFDGLREAFGNMGNADRGTLFNLVRNKIQFGLDPKDQAKILAAQVNISGASKETALQIQNSLANSASLRGVLPADVFQDIANATEQFATYAKDGGQNIGEAAIRARELGVSLDTVFKVSDGILDFQSSIESELKASLLIGRQLNLNEARRLAMAGDMAGLQEEILRQVGSEEELQRMNAIQRKSLAGALGVTVSELNKLASGELEVKNSDMKQNTKVMRMLTITMASLAAGLGVNLAGRGFSYARTLFGYGGGFTAERLGVTKDMMLASGMRNFAGTNLQELRLSNPNVGRGSVRGLGMAARAGQVGLIVAAIAGITILVKKLVGSSEETAENTKGRGLPNFITSTVTDPLRG